jgi:hypothetical protein
MDGGDSQDSHLGVRVHRVQRALAAAGRVQALVVQLEVDLRRHAAHTATQHNIPLPPS